jgi:HPt (histidine-containing phosphotransfer) domain-containing protein
VHSELLAAVATQDRQRASRAVHQLRSCAAMIGAQALSQQAATLERRWLDAPGADVEEEVVIRLLADVESIFSNNGPSA